MSLTTTKKIYLDFYNNSYQTINAKQLDAYSRHLNIVCTDYGKRVFINSETMSAFIRYKKSDGNDVFNTVEIMNDGSLLVAFTQQMLASEGISKFDILILNETGLKVDNLSEASFFDLGVSVLSTMCFYVNVGELPIEHPAVESSYEYNALTDALARAVATETHMKELDEAFNESEAIRQSNEKTRQNAENARVEAEIKREQTFNNSMNEWEQLVQTTIDDCNDATSAANTATSAANKATSAANTATSAANTATAAATAAASTANERITIINNIIDSFGKTQIEFTEAAVRENIQSGETLDILFGKIQKWFTDIELSFSGDITSDDIDQIINT